MSQLETNLKFRARAWAGELTKLAKSFAPAHIKDNISSHSEDKGDGTWTITVTANSPDARAQELGSGLRATVGEKSKYIIAPKTKKLLAFDWDVLENPDEGQITLIMGSPKFAGFLADGRVLFKYVEHPGINPYKGKGYLKPAVDALLERGKETLNEDVKRAILFDLNTAFKGVKP